jgi:cytochrome P450
VPDSGSRRTVDFDHHASSTDAHVWDAARALRETAPVGWNERYGGHWVVTSYDGVKRVMRDFRDFTARRMGDPEYSSFQVPAMKFALSIPAEFDPPDNVPYRRRLNTILSREACASLEPRIRHWATMCIDRVIERGECDLAGDIGTPIPALVSLEWLGMPADTFERATAAYHDYLGYPPEDPRAHAGYENVEWLNHRIREELDSRRREPQDDILTWLLHSEHEGDRLPFDDVVTMTSILVAAGIDTTTNGLAWAMLHFSRRPDHRARLRQDPELWDTAVDELLRRYPPVTSHARTAAHDVELEGCQIREGEKVLGLECSANHDATVFADPYEVILDRSPNRHLAFGVGVHRCAGMHLARLEMKVVLSEVIERLPDYEIDEAEARQYPDQGNVAGWQSLPATFTAGTRRLDSE